MVTGTLLNSNYVVTDFNDISRNRFTDCCEFSRKHLPKSGRSVIHYLQIKAKSVPFQSVQNLIGASSERFHGRERNLFSICFVLANRDVNCSSNSPGTT